MDFQTFINTIDEQINKTIKCKGYNAFKNDVEKLKQDNTGCGLSAITANVWLKKICELKDSVLLEYAEEYQLGQLNAWKNYK